MSVKINCLEDVWNNCNYSEEVKYDEVKLSNFVDSDCFNGMDYTLINSEDNYYLIVIEYNQYDETEEDGDAKYFKVEPKF